jgi:4-methylaminobutanoate oxidase (formaldehyde-forming)
MDIRRFAPFQGNRRYLHDRVKESVGLLYAPHWPFRQVETARGVRKTPLYDRLAARGACFGELMGWERANWFAPPGVEPRYEYSHARQNWFPYSAEEHRTIRENVGILDESTFGKILVSGPDACTALNLICTAEIDGAVGRIAYTQWLNDRGGIAADVTVTRLDETQFMVATSGATLYHDLDWLRKHILPDARAVVVDVSNASAVLGIMGPRSRELLSSLTDSDLSNEAFPFATSREIDLGFAFVRASRMTYVGELGWELWIPSDVALHVYDMIVAAGEGFGLRHAGSTTSARLTRPSRLDSASPTTSRSPAASSDGRPSCANAIQASGAGSSCSPSTTRSRSSFTTSRSGGTASSADGSCRRPTATRSVGRSGWDMSLIPAAPS